VQVIVEGATVEHAIDAGAAVFALDGRAGEPVAFEIGPG
jgi:hypothetical protein